MAAIIDDGAGLAGEVSADAPGKRVFPGVACSPEAKPAPSGTAGNTVEQHPGAGSSRDQTTRAGQQGFRAFHAACRTLAGYEAIHMLRKGQARWLSDVDVRQQNQFIHQVVDRSVAAAAAQGSLRLHSCNRRAVETGLIGVDDAGLRMR